LHFPARATAAVRANARTSYGYDPASRLTSLSHDLAGSANDLTLTFTHNPAGQIHSRTGSNDAYSWTGHGSGSTASAANGLNQIVDEGGTALAHDANGNMTYDGVRSYAYAADNRMIAAGSTNLDYNPLGQLLRAGDDMVDIDYVGERIVVERNGGNLEQRHYVHGPGVDEPLLWTEGGPYSEDRRYLYADERGSVIARGAKCPIRIAGRRGRRRSGR